MALITALLSIFLYCSSRFTAMAWLTLSSTPLYSNPMRHVKIQQSIGNRLSYSSITTNLSVTPVPVTTTLASTSTTQSLVTYFLETLISQGIPALFWILVIAFAAKSFSARKGMSSTLEDSLYGYVCMCVYL